MKNRIVANDRTTQRIRIRRIDRQYRNTHFGRMPRNSCHLVTAAKQFRYQTHPHFACGADQHYFHRDTPPSL